jgi:hypothetical protein
MLPEIEPMLNQDSAASIGLRGSCRHAEEPGISRANDI